MSRIGIVEEPSPWTRSEPISPMRDRATVLEAMGGRKSATPLFVAFAIILLFFIAGAVMLGIGISKAVANRSEDCTTDSPVITTNQPAITTKSPVATTKSSEFMEEDAAQNVTIVSFFLTLTNSNITAKELSENFDDAICRFWKQIDDVLPAGNRVVDIISIGGAPTTSKMSIFFSDSTASTLALVGISYTSEANVTLDQLKGVLSAGSRNVEQIENAGTPPKSKDTQLCTSVYQGLVTIVPTTYVSTTYVPTTYVPTTYVPTTYVPTTYVPTTPNAYTPCKKGIVFAMDISRDIDDVTFKAQKLFLFDYVFGGNFDYLDRLGLVSFYTNTKNKKFGTITDEQGLESVRTYINSQVQRKGSPHSFSNLFNDLLDNYDIGGGYDTVNYIVFISNLKTVEADSLIISAKTLKSRGRLTLILLGENADPDDQAKRLTDNIIFWDDPTTNPTPANWEYNLWTIAYGCEGGNIPPTVSIPPSPGTLPTDAPTTTLAPEQPQPCAGIFILGLDTSNSMSNKQFTNQKNFVSNELFSPSYFNHYERLSVGYYNNKGADVKALGTFVDEKGIQDYLSDLNKSSENSVLRRYFSEVAEQDFEKKAEGSPITVIAFVSSLTEQQANDTRDIVNPLKLKGISISLVGLGSVNEDYMKIVTGDKTRVFQWDSENKPEPSPDYKLWFKQFVKCPNSNQQFDDFEDSESSKKEIQNFQLFDPISQSSQKAISKNEDPYPCLNGNIILAYDVSLALNSGDFDTQMRFLVNHIFTEKFNHLERFTLIEYTDYVDSNTFFAKQTVDDILEHLLDSEQDGQPDLRLLFQTINTWRMQSAPEPIHTIVFVSKIDAKIANNILGYVQSLQNKNYHITFVPMGPLNLTLFKKLSPNVIQWDIGNQNEPSDWNQKFQEAFGCATTPTIIPIGPYPCSGNIIIAFDSSNGLNEDNYQRQISFLSTEVFNDQWSNLYRLSLIDYNNFASTQSYSTFETVQDVRDFIVSSYHSLYPPSLYHVIQSIDINNLASQTSPAHTIIFVSKISQEIVDNVKNFVDDLKKKQCTFTFVAIGKGVNIDLLKKLSKQVIQWDIDNLDEPKNWEELFWMAYGCEAFYV